VVTKVADEQQPLFLASVGTFMTVWEKVNNKINKNNKIKIK
jgi:hypothetical protein